MYRKDEQPTTSAESFKLPFEGKLSKDNRWVIMAQWIPWAEFETEYAELFSSEMGAPAKTFRTALGVATYNTNRSKLQSRHFPKNWASAEIKYN